MREGGFDRDRQPISSPHSWGGHAVPGSGMALPDVTTASRTKLISIWLSGECRHGAYLCRSDDGLAQQPP